MGASKVTLDRIAFLKAACAEAGYPNARILGSQDDPRIVLSGDDGVPDEVCWQAFELLAQMEGRVDEHPCFDCWMRNVESCPDR